MKTMAQNEWLAVSIALLLVAFFFTSFFFPGTGENQTAAVEQSQSEEESIAE